MILLLRTLFVGLCVSVSVTLRVSSRGPLNCSQQGLKCDIMETNCMDRSWLVVNEYTPSGPEELQVSVETRRDEAGQLQPFLLSKWKIKDDGSIRYLNATELHVLVLPTNENRCVRFSLTETLPMRSPSGEKWAFSADMLVVEPGQSYKVSVFNIPKPELGHSYYDVSADISVPGCEDPRMKMTQFCAERGSMWEANFSLSAQGSALTVSFSPDSLCDEYVMIVRCSTTNYKHVERASRTKQTSLNVTFSLDKWPLSCCQFDAEIKPLFPSCGQDCTRLQRTLNICTEKKKVNPTDVPAVPPYTFVTLGFVFMCLVTIAVVFVLCRKPGKTAPAPAHVRGKNLQLPKQPPKVLVIYSQDHSLYRDIVLKLCAFLQAKCGTKVLVDLLDTTSVGMVGRLRWLEWQRQQLKNPSDKILVLCSRGVQAKWRAMCGQGRVVLREDYLSPTDDMLTPFLNLFLPEMHQAGMLGKYMVAYFDDISSQHDVPSVFDIAVKYKLMKHFEELYFRILDEEKYQSGHVKHIEGIGGDEYFNCPSGSALKNAIETFQAFQLGNPDWFEKECMDVEEEVMTESKQLIDQLQIPPVLECVPLIRDGPPACICDIEINESGPSVHVFTPELNAECQLSSVIELTPLVNPEANQYPSNLVQVFTDHQSPSPVSVYLAEPVVNMPPPPRDNWPLLQVEPSGQSPSEDDEGDSLEPVSQISSQPDQRSSVLQNSSDSNPHEFSHASIQSEYLPEVENSPSQPVEVEEILESAGKGQISGSDQGYISKMSSQQEPPFKDPLAALRRLQEELLQDSLAYSDEQPEGN
uniref:Interleukin 17 receptor A n=1 Tax=Labrus bergylta TaxID=56723 RepID=A0A3Q3GGF2_9LABR|nr:interleukin-17 receptor A [Labrus bergylta]